MNLIRQGANLRVAARHLRNRVFAPTWPLNARQGRHEGFQKPIVAFVPSFGLSALTGVTSSLLPLWQDDLLLASLVGQTVLRVRIEDGRAVVVEPIPVSRRVRDIRIGNDGRIILWTDDDAIVFIEPAEAQAGDSLVAQCTACHGLNDWEATFRGPNLDGVVGRRVASETGFDYSAAMRAFGGRWTRERFSAFLADPQGVVPGTSMQFPGLRDSAQIARVIDYLEQLAAAPSTSSANPSTHRPRVTPSTGALVGRQESRQGRA